MVIGTYNATRGMWAARHLSIVDFPNVRCTDTSAMASVSAPCVKGEGVDCEAVSLVVGTTGDATDGALAAGGTEGGT